MPHSEIHKKKLKKNITIAAMVFLWCALIWAVTMIRIANATDYKTPLHNNYVGKNFSGIDVKGAQVDRKGAMYGSRFEWQQEIQDTQQRWLKKYQKDADARQRTLDEDNARRLGHFGKIVNTRDRWIKNWLDSEDMRLQAEQATFSQRTAHHEKLMMKPKQWWDGWSQRQSQKSE